MVHVTDHALLRWIERRYEMPVASWRRQLREEIMTALARVPVSRRATGITIDGLHFVISPEGAVVTAKPTNKRRVRVHHRDRRARHPKDHDDE